MLQPLIRTGNFKHMIAPRLIAGLPLAGIGMMHLTGAAPLLPILEAQGVPMPGLNAMVAPLFMVIAGLLLISGTLTRLGGVVGVMVMLGALHAHLTIDVWPNPDEPPIFLPIAVLIASAYSVFRGGGAWSVDRKKLMCSDCTESTEAPSGD